jgi:tetratricopeptide (TPR) repeat protein
MPNFVWSVTDNGGRQALREVAAENADESRRILVAQGCTDLVLKEDEISEAATAGIGKVSFLGEDIKVTAEQRLKHRGKRTTFLSALAEGLAKNKTTIALILLLGIVGYCRGNKTAIILAGVVLIVLMAFIIFVSLPSIYYRRLHKASDWHRWDEVLSLVNALERIGKIHFIKIPPPELGRYRAKAVAATGNLDAALREYQRYENQPGCPSWLYKAFVGGIYDLVKKHDKALEYNLMALAEKPSPVLYLDLANRYARYKKDAAKARAALAEAEKGPLPDLTIPGHHRYRGEVAYLEGDYDSAKKEIETSIALMEKTPHIPFRDGNIAIAKAYLSCVLARLNDRQGAGKNYRAALPYLEATGETELIEECKIELGKK